MKYEIIVEKENYALINRGESIKEYAVVYKLDKTTNNWQHTVDYFSYEYDGSPLLSKEKCLFYALNCLLLYTDDNYISLARLEELATLFKDGLFEIDEEYALKFIENNCCLEEYEKEFLGIERND